MFGQVSRGHVLVALNAAGLAMSMFLTMQHFGWAGRSSWCELGSSLSCSTVLTSSWAVLLGVPVAVHGVVYFVLALACAVLALLAGDFRARRDLALANAIVSAVGVLSVAYFVAAELVLHSLCLLCTAVHGIVISCFALSLQTQREQPGAWSVSAVPDLATRRITYVMLAVALVVTPVIVFNLPARHEHMPAADVAALAACLTERGVSMYGTSSCGHCIAQKGLFGEAFSGVRFVECTEGEGNKCKSANVKAYPTWIMGRVGEAGEERKEGVVSLRGLAQWAGCQVK